MKIVQTNGNSNNSSFGKLEKVKSIGYLNLKEGDNINLLSSIYKSKGLINFFEKYDGMILLEKPNRGGKILLFDILYKELSNDNFLKKLLTNVKDIMSYKEEYTKITLFKDSADKIAEKLKDISLQNIEKDINCKKIDKLIKKEIISCDKNHIQEKTITENTLTEYSELSPSTKKLIKKAGKLIEDSWTKFKKEKKDIRNFEFKQNYKGKTVTLKPVYESYKKFILLEIESEDRILKMTIDRSNFDYKLEKLVKTKFGTAGGKIIDSRKEKNLKAVSIINDSIEKYIPSIIRNFQPSEKDLYGKINSIFI